MKRIYFSALSVALCIGLILFSCKKKNTTTTTPSTTAGTTTSSSATTTGATTGGTTTGGTTTGGTTTGGAQTFTKMKIVSFKVTSFTFKDQYGYNWDANDGPDVYFTFRDQDQHVLVDGSGQIYNNVQSSQLPLNFTATYQINNVNDETFCFELWEASPGSTRSISGNCFKFKEFAADHPSTIEKDFGFSVIKFSVVWS